MFRRKKRLQWTCLPLQVSLLGILVLSWWETGGWRVKGMWPCYSGDWRVQDELIVVVERRKFWPLQFYLRSILADVAGFVWIHPSSKWRFSLVQPVTGPESHLMVLQGRLEIKLLINPRVWETEHWCWEKADTQEADWVSIRFKCCAACCSINVTESETFSPSVPLKCIVRGSCFRVPHF